MIEIGAGGGSIARVDCARAAQGRARLAPAPIPGPACYGRGGTEPTVTDADLVLGYLDPGLLPRRPDAARPRRRARRRSPSRSAEPLGLTRRGGRLGHPSDRQREHGQRGARPRLERGKDPRRPAGLRVRRRRARSTPTASPRALGSPALIAPFGAGVDERPSASWSRRSPSTSCAPGPRRLDDARLGARQRCWPRWRRGRGDARASGVGDGADHAHRGADMRYVGQGHEIRVPLPDGR